MVTIGKILRPQGIRGELKVESLTDNPARFERSSSVVIRLQNGEERRADIESVRQVKGFLVVVLSGCGSRSEAEQLAGGWILIPEDQVPDLPEGHYYHHEIVGMEVFLSGGGRYLGKIVEILPTGSNDVYIVRGGQEEYLIPSTREMVEAVDVPGRKMVIRPRAGWIE